MTRNYYLTSFDLLNPVDQKKFVSAFVAYEVAPLVTVSEQQKEQRLHQKLTGITNKVPYVTKWGRFDSNSPVGTVVRCSKSIFGYDQNGKEVDLLQHTQGTVVEYPKHKGTTLVLHGNSQFWTASKNVVVSGKNVTFVKDMKQIKAGEKGIFLANVYFVRVRFGNHIMWVNTRDIEQRFDLHEKLWEQISKNI
jgi:hypothetical protein